MGKKLYVGNLPYSADDQQLQDMFGECGTVASARIVTDRESGRSKGFGFVEMSSDEEANSAITKFNGQDFSGRKMVVSEARPQEPRGDRGGFGGGGGGRRPSGGGGRGGGGGGFRSGPRY